MKIKILPLALFFSTSLFAGIHPVPHYDHQPMPPCACQPYHALRDKPISQTNLARWAEHAAINLYSYGFGNYEASFKQASHFFTPEGWQIIQGDLEDSGNVDQVVENKLLVSAQLIEPAFLLRQVSDNEWIYQMKIAVSYDSADKRVNQVMKLNVLMKKFKPLDRVDSVGVHRIASEVMG